MKKILNWLLSKKVEQKRQELISIQHKIDITIENMRYAKWNKLEAREDYLYSDLTVLWKKQKSNKRFIKLFGI